MEEFQVEPTQAEKLRELFYDFSMEVNGKLETLTVEFRQVNSNAEEIKACSRTLIGLNHRVEALEERAAKNDDKRWDVTKTIYGIILSGLAAGLFAMYIKYAKLEDNDSRMDKKMQIIQKMEESIIQKLDRLDKSLSAR